MSVFSENMPGQLPSRITAALLSLQYSCKRGLARSSAIYVMGTGINSAISFITIFLLTRFLSPHAFGLVSMYQVTLNLMLPILSLNLHASISVRYFLQDKADMQKYISTQITIVIMAIAACTTVFLAVGPLVSKLTAIPLPWLWTLFAVGLCLSIQKIAGALWLAQNKAATLTGVGIVQNLTGLLFMCVLVIACGLDWQGRIESIIISSFVTLFVVLIVLCRDKKIALSFDWKFARSGLGFGIPLIPHDLGSFSLASLDRFFITKMVSMSAMGVYSAGYQIGSIMNILVESFNRAYVPWLFSRLKKNDRAINAGIVRFTYLYFVLIIGAGLCLWGIISLCLKFIVGAAFLTALPFIPWIIAACVFNGMYLMVTNYILFASKTHLIGGVTMLTAALSAVSTYFLIRYNGALGAAQSAALSYLLLFLFTWVLSARVFPMPWFRFSSR